MEIIKILAYITLVGFGICVLVIALFWLGYFIRDRIYRAKHPDYNRALTQSEYDIVELAYITIDTYNFDREYPKIFNHLTYGGAVPVILSWIAVGATTVVFIWGAMNYLITSVGVVDEGSISGITFAASLLSGLFLGIVIASIVCILLARKNQNFMDYLTYKLGWGRSTAGERNETNVEGDLFHLIRTKQLHSSNAKDYEALTRLMFERFTSIWKLGAIMFTGLYIVALFWDAKHLMYVTPSLISQAQTPFGNVDIYPLAKLKTIERECYIYTDYGDLEVNLTYTLHFIGGREIVLEAIDIAKVYDVAGSKLLAASTSPVTLTKNKHYKGSISLDLCLNGIENKYMKRYVPSLKDSFSG